MYVVWERRAAEVEASKLWKIGRVVQTYLCCKIQIIPFNIVTSLGIKNPIL